MKDHVQLVVSGGIRTGADVAKALALGADAVSIGQGSLSRSAATGRLTFNAASIIPLLPTIATLALRRGIVITATLDDTLWASQLRTRFSSSGWSPMLGRDA